MEARAKATYVRGSTRKTNLVLDLVRGKDVESAIHTLSFTQKHVARTVLKVLKSAVANAVVMESRLHPEDLFVKECLCGPAPIMKRFLPRAQGRATPILKRSCHITIVVGARPGALERHHAAVSAAASGTSPAKGGRTAGKPAGAGRTAAKKTGTATAAPAKKKAGAAEKSAGAGTGKTGTGAKKKAGAKTAKAGA